ncbi:MinD/ParA family protein [Lachnoclostridium phytofermentans]|uniref:Cobyrinic acid ac-diamide synthase n=1 Tax=Lachnoclostridium phytofermentans (strain ATCC 700394 / DSM 18823 / ISDg) TaxID=357809 RepID=A9KND7_LACP7|nr:MinD/ParA family protein [Lachnoclostridium phytofermentans]ABX43054.1 Cobyrinic acid ac-diamide synthase [Lachnoclostridium phytofermentans ISDg]
MDQAEQLRRLVNQQTRPRGTARVITITSGKGGVGKSSTSLNLAIALSRLGNRVLILDADFGLANIEVMLGIRPKYNLADLMFQGKELKDIITQGPQNVGFISGGSGIAELTRLTKEQIMYLIEKMDYLDDLADIIIVDTGAGISDLVMEFVSVSSEVLLVTTPEPTSITDAYAVLKALYRRENFNKEETVIKLISNRIYTEEEGKEIYNKLNSVGKKFLDIEMEYLGGIPQDRAVSQAIMQQKPIIMAFPNSVAAKAINTLAERIHQGDIKIPNETRGIKRIFASLIRRGMST